MRSFLRLSLLRRFLRAVQADGPVAACRRAWGYLRRRALGHTATGLAYAAPGPGGGALPYLGGIWTTLARQGAFHVTAAPATLQKRRKIALIGDLNLPQCRKYRVEQLVELWRRLDVDLDYAHFQDVPRSVAILQEATHLFCYRLQAQPIVSTYLYEARRLGLPILYDIDDPLFSVPAYETYGNMAVLGAAARAHFVAQAPGYLDVMNAADRVSVSTPGLADHARQLTQRPVHLRCNFADCATLRAGRAAATGRIDDGLFRVAFVSGSQGHEADFETISDPLLTFLEGGANRRLMICGHFDRTRLDPRILSRTQWHGFAGYDGYLRTLAQADCIIAPLADDLFNRCKSAVRGIDAAAVGVPVIASAVGDFPHLIRHGQTGFIADAPMDWAALLETLANDPEAARGIGAAARRVLERDWSSANVTRIMDTALCDWVLA